MGSQKLFFSLEHFREWMEQIYFRKWVSGEGKRLDLENKHILHIRIFVIAPWIPGVPNSENGDRSYIRHGDECHTDAA